MELSVDIIRRLAPTAEGIPVYIDPRPPQSEDPARPPSPYHWVPACHTTSKLARCLEAVRDVSTALAPLSASPQPDADKRMVKHLIPPIYNLAIAIRDLFNDVQSTQWTRLDKKRQEKLAKRFKQFGEAVPTGKGALKTARNKIGAHLDKDTFTWEYRQFWDAFGIADTLGWVRGCMRMLQVLIPPDIYTWTRASREKDVVNLMTADGSEVSIRLKDGEPEALIRLQITSSPKLGFVQEARALAEKCVEIEQRLGIVPSADAAYEP
jgi:hypothetical protein